MKQNIYQVLKQYYGYDSFRNGQEQIINQILQGNDVLGILPTGAGKSICFQIPALIFEGVTLVISPLISLMKDQVDSLCEMGIQAAYLNSSLSASEYEEIILKAKNNEYKLLYVAPERLETEPFIDLIQSIKIAFVAVDEAHCVSSWGHDFRPSYTRISKLIDLLLERPIIGAFTATATPVVKEDIINLLDLQNPFTLTTGFDRENLYFEVLKPSHKLDALINLIQRNKNQSGIIYCSTRKTVESLYDTLIKKGISVTKYHAGLTEEERTNHQEDFIYDRKQIMIATNAFGMGIDKSNIRYVVHYNMPKNMESYYQEAGRAGRDGEASVCVLLYSASDIVTNKFLIENGGDSFKEVEYDKLNQMVNYCNTDLCLRKFILNYFGEQNSIEKCDHCSNCTSEVEQTDITVDAQKIISCIKRMDERFGINLVVDVLAGSNTEKIRSLQFNDLSTYGIMKDYSKDTIKEIITFLIAQDYLKLIGNQYPIIKIEHKATGILKGNEKVLIKRVISKNNEVKSNGNEKSDAHLFEILRQLRKKCAEEKHLPPFMIFSDATLNEMTKKYPTTKEAFLTVSGVGELKYQNYGDVFIHAIKDYVETREVSKKAERKSPDTPSKMITYGLYQEGHSIDEIVKLRELSNITIEGHLLDCFNDGLPYEMNIPEDIENKIIDTCQKVGTNLLKPIKEALHEEVTYSQIKYIMIKHQL